MDFGAGIRKFTLGALAVSSVLLAGGSATSQAQTASPKQPNIVIIWGDDIGQTDVSAYSIGLMGFHPPNIDRVAKEGMLFTDYYAEQSCTAGRASFITGQSGLRTGLTKVGLPGAAVGLQKQDPTIAELLKARGYATGQFGKNHLGDRNEYLPTLHGFDEFYGNLYHLNAEEEPEDADYPKDPDRRHLYERYRYQDSAIKVVGVGSVGTRCYLSLLLADNDDPLFLQVKEARRSVLEPPRGKSRYAHQGLRVVEGQRVMQAASDIFLGWARTEGHDYYFRQFRDMKVSAEVETFRPGTLVGYASLCGWTLARAHAKAGDAAMIAGYLGANDQFDDALANTRKATLIRLNVTSNPSRQRFVPAAFRPNQRRMPGWSSCCRKNIPLPLP
jgi:hypothetical protein